MQLTTKWCRHNYYNNCLYYSALQKSKSAKSYSDINLFGLRTIYIVIFLCCSVLSLFSYGLLYSVCLLYIVVNNDILQRALQSVTKNGTTVFINTSCWPGFFLETFRSGGRSIKGMFTNISMGLLWKIMDVGDLTCIYSIQTSKGGKTAMKREGGDSRILLALYVE